MILRVAIVAAGLCAVAVAFPRFVPSLMSIAVNRAAPADDPPPAPKVAAKPAPAVEPARRDEEPRRLSGRQVALRADPRGHYLTTAMVNGRSIDVMVDTGATTVALTDSTARRLGIYLPLAAYTVRMSTANGSVMAARVTLNEVRVGSVAVRNVEATVAPGESLGVNLLGMSFLGRLSKFEVAGGQLVLSQ